MDTVGHYATLVDCVVDLSAADTTISILHSSPSTIVYRVESGGLYAVRVSVAQSPDHAVRMGVLREVGSLGGRVATILHSEERRIGEHQCTVDIMPFLPGEPLNRSPSQEETRGIIDTMYALHRGLKGASPAFLNSGLPSLSDLLHGLLATAEPGRMRAEAEMFLEDERFMQLLAAKNHCLTYGDPWPLNFLIEQGTEPIRVRIVDIDPIFMGPAILQPALLFSACFVASSVLFQDEGMRPDLDALIQAWPEEIDRDDTIRMMRVYPILLSLVKLAEGEGQDPQLRDANLRLLQGCLEVVDSYE